MSTTATIAITKENGSVDMIHVHWDGYLTWIGRILVQHYNDRKQAEKLIALGDLSTLGNTPDKTDDKHNTTAYHRDWSEDLRIQHFKDVPQYLNSLKHDGEEYNYILGKNKLGDDQWYWVTDSDIKPIFYDEDHIDVKHYFVINPKSVNIADLLTVENTFDLDKSIRDNSQKSLDKTKEAVISVFIKKLMHTHKDLFNENWAAGQTISNMANEYNHTIPVMLQDPETHKNYSGQIYYDMVDLNQAIPRQVLEQLVDDVERQLKRNHALYTVDEIPVILKVSTIKKDIDAIYHGKNKQGNIAFYYFLHLCQFYEDADNDKEILNEVMPKLYKYVKKGVDELYQNLETKYDITAKDVRQVMRTVNNGDPYQECTTPYEDYIYHLERGDNPKDELLVGDPFKHCQLYKELKRMYKDQVAKDIEHILEQVQTF